jgi:hypothetical protein
MALDGDTLTYTDQGGLVRKESKTEFLAILPQEQDAAAGPTTALRPPSEVELVDGQRFPGTFGAIAAPAGEPVESIAWDNATLGTLDLKLDHIRRIQLRPDPSAQAARTPAAPGDSDIVILTNGDRVPGLLEGFLADGPAARLSSSGQSRDIPLDRIQEFRLLTNPAAAAPADSTIVWLRDGAVAACRSLHTSRTGEVALEIAPAETATNGKTSSTLAASGNVGIADILAVDLHPGALVPLASITPSSQKPGPGRRWTKPIAAVSPDALLRLSDVEIPGPMSAEWELPAGIARFAAEVELPRSDWDWGDAELSVTLVSGGRETELFRRRLSAEQPRAAINAALDKSAPGARLRIRLDAGAYGPVQDRVVLHRPVLLGADK